MYDCAIIGTGAAGVSAALTLKALKREFILIGNPDLSSKTRSAERIKNFVGLPSVSGEELAVAFSKQLKGEGIKITEGTVNGIYPAGNYFGIACGSELYEAKTVILATGVESVKPIKGEREFLGRGVSYCAVCDGFLYKDKTIAVICTAKEEEDEIRLLAKYAAEIYLFPLYKDIGELPENVEMVQDIPQEIIGDTRVKEIVAKNKKYAVDGVFMLKDSVAADALIAGIKTENGIIQVNRACETSVAGVFAAGDCTGRPYQYAKAAGEGNVCAYSVNAYLNGLKK